MLEAAPLAIVTVDQDGKIIFGNTKLEELFGYRQEELVGQSIELLLPDRLRKIHVEHRADYLAAPRVRPMGSGLDLVARHKTGAEFPIEVGLSTVQLHNDLLVIGSITDISLRKQTEEMLEQRVIERTREIERRRQVADGLRDILKILNSNRPVDEILNHIVKQTGRLLKADASAIYRLPDEGEALVIQASQGLSDAYVAQANIPITESRFGQTVLKRQVVTVSDVDRVLSDRNPETKTRRKALLNLGYHAVLAVPLTTKDEVYGSLMLYYTQPHEFSAEEVDLAVTFGDQAALAIANARLRTQVEQAAVAAERNRLARDLHDSVTQTLFSASLIAEVLPRLTRRNPSEAERRLAELRQLTRGALAEMRTLLLELRPSRLTEVELGDLLRQLSEAITGRARVPIHLQVEGRCTLPPDVKVSLYRTAQEALNNVAKHAQASQVRVQLRCQNNCVELTINDDGRGFLLERVPPGSLGLTIMHERAEAIDAALKIESQPGQGTGVSVIWHPNNAQEQIERPEEARKEIL